MADVLNAPIDLGLGGLKLNSDSPIISFETFDLPASNQRELGYPHPPGTVTPLAFRPSEPDVSLDSAVATIEHLSKSGILVSKLARHGCLLFRGLPIHNASDFSKFSHAFGFKPHEIIGIVVNRPDLAPNVAPANEAPLTTTIYSHNESPQVPHAPSYIFFYSHRAPKSGGESPIGSSLEIFARLQQEAPEFIQDLAQKGILTKVTYAPGVLRPGGSTLKQAFGKEINEGDSLEVQRQKGKLRIRRYNRGKHTTWEWQPDGSIVLTHRLPVIRTQPGTNLPSLFNSLAAYFKFSRGVDQFYGDGSVIPERYLELAFKITQETRVLHKWQQGDVLVYDNIIAQHGREPWQGEQEDRQVMASLWDGELPGPYGFEDWAKVVPALP
ncbi:hypothetical protein MNV49_000954 [Pseudohyphozyma bogoriensis]|nr:hypothetical protein MNV49_000954 [Pseudohyphozyma bogoriensis]